MYQIVLEIKKNSDICLPNYPISRKHQAVNANITVLMNVIIKILYILFQFVTHQSFYI